MDELEVDAISGQEAEASEYLDMRGFEYAAIHTQRGARGKLKWFVESVIGFYFGPDEKLKSVATLRGVFESPAILGPFGEVTFGDLVFEDIDLYLAWAQENQQ